LSISWIRFYLSGEESLYRSAGGQFVAHIKSQPGAPYDGHTLAALIPDMEEQLGTTINRIIADRGYRGHNAPSTHQFKVYIAGQKRWVTDAIKHELRRRPAVEPVIGHLKEDHRMGPNFLAHAAGDAFNAILAAAGYNFRRILAWLKLLCAWFILLMTLNRSQNYQPARV
jgi:IS5 family transposase